MVFKIPVNIYIPVICSSHSFLNINPRTIYITDVKDNFYSELKSEVHCSGGNIRMADLIIFRWDN